MTSEAHDIKASIRIYLFIFGALAVLTVATVAASLLHLTIIAAVVLALVIASLKGSLVAGFFMHLLHERRGLYALIALCALFFMLLILLPVLQTSETAGLIDPVYKQLGETHPVPAAPAEGAHSHAAAEEHGH